MGREEVRFASGGDECAAWLFRPEAGAVSSPCVVMASGLTCVRDQGLDGFARRFADAGFAVLAFDYRHFGDSGGEPRSLMSSARQREDWRAAIGFACSLGEVDEGRVALWGFSLGGGHVQSLVLTESGIAAAICVAPVVDGARSLLHIGGPAHLARLGLAGIRDGLRALRGANPYRIPAVGPPGSLAVFTSPGSSRVRVGDLIAVSVAKPAVRSRRADAVLPAGEEDPPHRLSDSLLPHRGRRHQPTRSRHAGGGRCAERRAAPLPRRALRSLSG